MIPYLNPPGFVGEAEKNIDGTYTITPLGEGSLTFDSTGKLTTLSNRCDDGEQTVSYTSGRPTAITDSLSDRAITLTWNGSGKLTGITDSMSHSWTLGYSQAGDDLVSITQPVASTPPDCEFSYDANHKMETHTDFLGSVYEIDYITSGDHTGKLYSVTDPNNHVTSFAYAVNVDGYAKQTILTDAEDRDTAYYFGSTSGQMERIQQGSGATSLQTTFAYNPLGLVSSVTDSYSKSSSYTYDTVGHLLVYTAPAPAENEDPYVSTMTYSPPNSVDGLLVSKSETVASQTDATTIYEYEDEDAPCKPSSITDPLSQETTIDYNSVGLMASVTQPIPDSQTKTTSFAYSQTTYDLTKVTDAEGNDTVMTYNGNGLVSNRTVYNGTQLGGAIAANVDFTYSDLLLITGTDDAITDLTTSASFNVNGATLSVTSALGCSSSQSFSTITNTATQWWKHIFRKIKDGSYRPTPITVSPGWGGGVIRLPVTFPIYDDLNPCSSTDSQSHTTTFTYDDSGLLTQATDYLDNDTDYTYDIYGRLYTVTGPDGNTVTYDYNRNSWVTSVTNESTGTTGYTYDFAGRVTDLTDPVKGTIEYEYNLRGNRLSETFGAETNSFGYDLLGRKTAAYYEYGSSESWTYTPDGYLASHNGITYECNKIGAVTEADLGSDGTMTYAYTDTLSEVLMFPSSVTGTNNLGDYAFTYSTQHWLSGLTDTSKTNQSYTYAYSSSKELNELDYPNTLELHQTWNAKMLDSLTVTDANQQTTYLSSDATYNGNEQMTDYDFSVNAGQNTFSEAYDLTYDTKGRLSTMETDSSNRTLTYGYDASNGQLTSLQFSDLGTYSIDYLTNGNIDSITYPNTQGEETYTYSGGKGRLSEIAYPNDDTLEFQWNAKDQVSRLDYYDFSADSTTSYVLTYNDLGRLASSTHLVDSVTQSVWTYAWGMNGLEKATKTVSGLTTLTQDFTTDPQGRILSMTYSTPGEGYDGELYFHYDHYGNTTLLTNPQGSSVASFQYDLHSGKIVNEWNPEGLVVFIKFNEISKTNAILLTENFFQLTISTNSLISLSNSFSLISIMKINTSIVNQNTNFLSCSSTNMEDSNYNLIDCDDFCSSLTEDQIKKIEERIGKKLTQDEIDNLNKMSKDCCSSYEAKRDEDGRLVIFTGDFFDVVIDSDGNIYHNCFMEEYYPNPGVIVPNSTYIKKQIQITMKKK